MTTLNDYFQDRQFRRSWSLASQDGIIGTAGILLGLTGAGASEATLLVAVTTATVAGMLTTGGAKWSETAAEREAQLRAISQERSEFKSQRGVERAVLVGYYTDKGLSHDLADKVAGELMLRNPLKAGLESEHGIFSLTSRGEVVFSGLSASVAYALGAAIPFGIAYFLPVEIEIWVIVLAVILSLTFVSIAGARAGHMDVSNTILRTLVVGSVTISISYLVGEFAF